MTIPTNPRFGWLPDPAKRIDEAPDYNAEPLLGAPTPPVAANAMHLVPDILNQGNLASCTANAVMQAIRASHIKQGVSHTHIGSRLFAYFFGRALHGATHEDQGSYIRLVFQALNTFGFPAETFWPYDETKVFKAPGKNAVRMAYDQLAPTEYYRIGSSNSQRSVDVKRAIAAGHLVVFGTQVGKSFGSIDTTRPAGPPVAETLMGGHAMCIAGYDGDVFRVVNSWGPDWGDNGTFLMSAEYLEWYRTNDLWVVATAPTFSEGSL